MRRSTAVALVAATLLTATAASVPAEARVPNPNPIALTDFSHILFVKTRGFLLSQGTAGPVQVIHDSRSSAGHVGSTAGTTDLEPELTGTTTWSTVPARHQLATLQRYDEWFRWTYDTGSACPVAVAPTEEGIWFVDRCPGQPTHLDVLDPKTSTVTQVAALGDDTVIATDHRHTLYLADAGAAGAYSVRALTVTGGPSPSATQTLTSPDLSGSTPRDLAVSRDGSTLATSVGAVLATADLSLLAQEPAPTHDTAVAVTSDGVVALASGSHVDAYLPGDTETYNSFDVAPGNVQPHGLAFDGRMLAIVQKTGSTYQVRTVEVRAFTSLRVHVDRRRVAYHDRIRVSADTQGLPDGTKVTLRVHGSHAGKGTYEGIVQSDAVSFGTTTRLKGSGKVTVTFPGDEERAPAEASTYVTVVKHLVHRPRHAISRIHGVYHLRAGRDAVFVTHLHRPFVGACLSYQTSVKVRGGWIPYARVKGCLPVPASGVNVVRLPASLAVPGHPMRSHVEVFPNHRAFANDDFPMLRPRDVRFIFVR